jgi:ribosomal protein S2
LGHHIDDSSIDKGRHLFLGTRNKRLLYNYDYLFINFFKKANFLRKLINSGSEFIFLTARKEFEYILEKHASACGCRFVVYSKAGDIDSIFNSKKYASINSPIFLLFNNDPYASYNCIQELMSKRALSISIIDTNSLGIDYFYGLYGNDDGYKSISFYARLLSNLINSQKEPYRLRVKNENDAIFKKNGRQLPETKDLHYLNKVITLKKKKILN